MEEYNHVNLENVLKQQVGHLNVNVVFVYTSENERYCVPGFKLNVSNNILSTFARSIFQIAATNNIYFLL